MREGIQTEADWAKLLISFALLYAALQWAAATFQSLRGEFGLLVALTAVGASLFAQDVLFTKTRKEAVLGLGLGAPRLRGILAALAVSALMLLAYPIFLLIYGGGVSIYPGAAWLALGIFLQGGLAEEVIFRGYLYGHIRRGRPFWRAAALSAIPFAIAHLYLFFTMAWPIALAALGLAVLSSFPFAWLYELGGRTIWAPAIAHAVVQGAIKIFVVEDPVFPILWMAASLAALWLVFAISSSTDSRS